MASTARAAQLIDEIASNGKKLSDTDHESARRNIIAAANDLIVQLENPSELMIRMGWEDPFRNAALRTVFELGLLKRLGSEAVSSEQLAEGTDADADLVARMMRVLTAYGLVNEVGVDRYTATPFSMATKEPYLANGLVWLFEMSAPSIQCIPEYLARSKYKLPTDNDGPMQIALNTPKSFFAYLQDNPRLGTAFNEFIGGWSTATPHWTTFYPCEERLFAGTTAQEQPGPLLVDIGGALGRDLAVFQAKFPDQKGELVLEDQSHVIEACRSSNTLSGVTLTSHDFFTPQPASVKGARAYFLKHTLHDWSDEQCRVILGHIRDSMTPGYSRVLINEVVMGDVGASRKQVGLDGIIMAVTAGRERSESQWRRLLESVGLKVTGIWGTEGAIEGIVEAMKDE